MMTKGEAVGFGNRVETNITLLYEACFFVFEYKKRFLSHLRAISHILARKKRTFA
jgi:hypothetical protein